MGKIIIVREHIWAKLTIMKLELNKKRIDDVIEDLINGGLIVKKSKKKNRNLE